MFKFTTKWFDVPVSSETKQVEAVQLWEVRWLSRHNDGYASYGACRQQLEAFTTEEAAEEFRKALIAAFKLVRQRVHTDVSITRAR